MRFYEKKKNQSLKRLNHKCFMLPASEKKHRTIRPFVLVMLRLLLGEIRQAAHFCFCLASVYCIQNLKITSVGQFWLVIGIFEVS